MQPHSRRLHLLREGMRRAELALERGVGSCGAVLLPLTPLLPALARRAPHATIAAVATAIAGLLIAVLPHCTSLRALLALSVTKGVCFTVLEPSKQLALLELYQGDGKNGEADATTFLAWQASLRGVAGLAKNAAFGAYASVHVALPFWMTGALFAVEASLLYRSSGSHAMLTHRTKTKKAD